MNKNAAKKKEEKQGNLAQIDKSKGKNNQKMSKNREKPPKIALIP